MALPERIPQGAQTTGRCACLPCWGTLRSLACPSSPQCGRKAPLDCGSEAWPRLGLCPRRGSGTPPPHPVKQLCHPAVPVAAMVSGWDWVPGAAEGHVAGTVHSVVCLCRGWHFSGPPALRAEPHLHHLLGIKVSAFLRGGVFMGENRPWARLHSDRRTHPGETHHLVQTFHTHPRSPTFPFRPLQLGNEAGITAKTKGPLSVIISETTSN